LYPLKSYVTLRCSLALAEEFRRSRDELHSTASHSFPRPGFIAQAARFWGPTLNVTAYLSPHSRIATPFNVRHFTGGNIDIERSAAPRSSVPILRRDGVVARSYRNSKAPLIICRKRCDRSLFALHHEVCVRKRTAVGNVGSARPRTNWTDCDDATDSRSVSSV
jgi:hypothetical protein